MSSYEVWYLFSGKPSFCDVALIRPGLCPAHLPPRGRLLQRDTNLKHCIFL